MKEVCASLATAGGVQQTGNYPTLNAQKARDQNGAPGSFLSRISSYPDLLLPRALLNGVLQGPGSSKGMIAVCGVNLAAQRLGVWGLDVVIPVRAWELPHPDRAKDARSEWGTRICAGHSDRI